MRSYMTLVWILFNTIKITYYDILQIIIRTNVRFAPRRYSWNPVIHDWMNGEVHVNEMGSRIENVPEEQRKWKPMVGEGGSPGNDSSFYRWRF